MMFVFSWIFLRKKVNEEIMEIEDSIKSNQKIGCKDLVQPNVLKALLIGVGLQLFQQFIGINTAMYYRYEKKCKITKFFSASIIVMAGFTNTSQALWLSLAVASTNAVMTVVTVIVVDKIGKNFG